MKNIVIREPIQKRSIETKDKILAAGLELICNEGYYKTNTSKIAKKAGVSTGIVYQYFNSKHDILIESLEKFNNVIFFSSDKFSSLKITAESFSTIVKDLINEWIEERLINFMYLSEITSLMNQDDEIRKIIKAREEKSLEIIEKALLNSSFPKDNIKEKVILLSGIFRNTCHEIVYYKHKNINNDTLIDLSIKSMLDILNNKEPISK